MSKGTDIVSNNGLLTIQSVQVTLCSVDDCTKRVRKDNDLCAGHYRLSQDDKSNERFQGFLKAWNAAIAKATDSLKGSTPKGSSAYVIRTNNARSKFAYFAANHSGMEVFEPGVYGQARTFGVSLPNDKFAKAFIKDLNASKSAKTDKVVFDILRTL
jgi:hypothetical protein